MQLVKNAEFCLKSPGVIYKGSSSQKKPNTCQASCQAPLHSIALILKRSHILYFNRKEDQRERSSFLLHKSVISRVKILALLVAVRSSTSYYASLNLCFCVCQLQIKQGPWERNFQTFPEKHDEEQQGNLAFKPSIFKGEWPLSGREKLHWNYLTYGGTGG